MAAETNFLTVPLTVRNLTNEDLPNCVWAGGPLHIEHMRAELPRAERGEVDYLVLCPPSGLPVAKGGVDYTKQAGAGELWQLAVLPALQSCGLGTLLIGALEARVRARGLDLAVLGVEENNPRARLLYERLGYTAFGSRPDGWDQQREDGTVYRYETVCTLLRKPLG